MLTAGVQLPDAASYNSALARADELFSVTLPPTTRTWPFANSAAPCPQRASLRLPVRSQVPPLATDAGEPVSSVGAEPGTTLVVGAAAPGRSAMGRATARATEMSAIASAATAILE